MIRYVSKMENDSRDEDVRFVDKTVIPSCKFDNSNILLLRALKAEKMTMPKINGSLLHCVPRKRKSYERDGASTLVERGRAEWKAKKKRGNKKKGETKKKKKKGKKKKRGKKKRVTIRRDVFSVANFLCSPAKTETMEEFSSMVCLFFTTTMLIVHREKLFDNPSPTQSAFEQHTCYPEG